MTILKTAARETRGLQDKPRKSAEASSDVC